jgi:glycerol-3-phosphate dehydrogenase (NAD(P)+)
MNIGVVGEGKFGQAIGSLLEYNDIAFEYAEKSRPFTRRTDLIFLMLPTQFIRSSFKENAPFITDETIIVNGSKGIEEKTHLLPRQIVKNLGSYPNYYSLVGPSFAHGIKAKHPTIVSLGYKDPEYVDTIKDLLQTPYFRVHATPGYPALELASAMKNLYAILCGYAHGLGYGMNTQALLITLAMQEFTRLSDAMGFNHYDVMSPGVVGDLMLTCSSQQSRNFKFGLYLAKYDKERALKTVNDTVEGYYTSHSVKVLAKENKVDLPLALLTLKLINHHHKQGANCFQAFIGSL